MDGFFICNQQKKIHFGLFDVPPPSISVCTCVLLINWLKSYEKKFVQVGKVLTSWKIVKWSKNDECLISREIIWIDIRWRDKIDKILIHAMDLNEKLFPLISLMNLNIHLYDYYIYFFHSMHNRYDKKKKRGVESSPHIFFVRSISLDNLLELLRTINSDLMVLNVELSLAWDI